MELTSHRLEDLFIDVEAVRVAVPNNIVGRISVQPDSAGLGGAASYLNEHTSAIHLDQR
ncbi:hypothetical protein P8A18_31760 [Streptomyces castrisilvae]|uniref:Uncharacterized protein n=1 Tax=Streptomyces castrisilvae TaxID=3033811 RepID=A0ABY9HUT1_9ACTN|nr:hypothetical protein [Streptomyces sp. Mut1]WLQ37738.1 hypothetical protein P8A18_31760 [Streptomyces sp. Mut1]